MWHVVLSLCLYNDECVLKEARLPYSENSKIVTIYDLTCKHTDMKTIV